MTTTPQDIAGLRFLVVEDQGFQRWVLGNTLEAMGANMLFSADDGRMALEILKGISPPIDVVVTDLSMPRMDGIEFIRHIGEQAPHVALIVVSEQDTSLLSTVGAMARAYGLNLLDVIAKPISTKKLWTALGGLQAQQAPRPMPSYGFAAHEMEEGLTRGEFEAFYQPKVEIATGHVRGAEAVARWRHPQHGTVLPAAFMPVLEAAGLLDSLTSVVLRHAVETCRDWHRAGFEPTVAVNFSMTSLHDTSLADRVLTEVKRVGLAPRHVVLEVTETAAATNVGRMLDNLSRLRMMGFGLSIDDYGTGYSSMAQLTQVPFTEIKIDQAFVRNAPSNPSSRAVLESALQVAATLGIPAVAEGVETKAELALLLELRCPIAQGYYLGAPMTGDDFLAWLLEKQRSTRVG